MGIFKYGISFLVSVWVGGEFGGGGQKSIGGANSQVHNRMPVNLLFCGGRAGGRLGGWVNGWLGRQFLGLLGILVFVVVLMLVWCMGAGQLVQVVQAAQAVQVV
eukprot:s3098_g1.t1